MSANMSSNHPSDHPSGDPRDHSSDPSCHSGDPPIHHPDRPPIDCESKSEKALFSPPLSQQRYSHVCELAEKFQTKSIVDLGCGECRLVQKLKNLDFVERIVGVDVDKVSLNLSKIKCRPLTSDHLCPRSRPLTIELYEGDITQPDSRLADGDMVLLVEVVEHLKEEDLKKLPEVVFGIMNPEYCVVTTPNSEYNVVFKNFTGFRHWDHKFEWNRSEFQTWSQKIANEYDYQVEFNGVGEPPEDHPNIGFCTQIAVFHRKNKRINHATIENRHVLICREIYPHRTADEIKTQNICSEVERLICKLTVEDELNEVRVDTLYSESVLTDQCGMEEFSSVLERVGYALSADRSCVLIDRRERFYWSDDGSGGQFSDAEEDESAAISFDRWRCVEHELWD